ncbi:MAG: hypothetical protein NTY37_11240 [Methanothrix sp.]|nr:hypothetical protein [Methanothrix sp.]
MRSKMAMRFALISAIFFISLAMVFAETTSQTDQSLMAGQNATLNQTMNETINQTLNETINQTTNMTPDLANIFKKVKGIPMNESER